MNVVKNLPETDDISFNADPSMSEITMFSCVEARLSDVEEETLLENDDELIGEEQSEETFADNDCDRIFSNSLTMVSVSDIELTSTRENKCFFVIYLEPEGDSPLGCCFTHKRSCKDYVAYDCKLCRRIVDQEKRANKETPSEQQPAKIRVVNGSFVDFLKVTHHMSCYVETLAKAYARSEKNVSVQHKGKFGVTAKQAYDIYTKRIERKSENLNITPTDIAEGFKSFDAAKGALNKASNRKSAAKIPNMMDDDGKVNKLATKLPKTVGNHEPEYFLIYESAESGTIVLGSIFLLKMLFESGKAGSDGTFKMAPIGYTQVYMLWSLNEGFVEDESAPRSKAIPGVYMFLKGKTQALYHEAFSALENYRLEKNLPDPAWSSYLMDDEQAVQNVVTELYSYVDIELCFFHVNKNILKCLIKFKLSSFVKKCKSDGELWFYGKFKQILVLPLLPLDDIHVAFKSLKAKILAFFEYQFESAYQLDQLNKFFDSVEENYYGNANKMKKICKYKKTMRGTNLIEASHSGFNKSLLTPKHTKVSNLIYGLKCIDIQYQALAVDFKQKGVKAFPKKKKTEQEREKSLQLYYEQLENKIISTEQFLELAAELWIEKKYYVMIQEATKAVESITENTVDPVDIADIESINECERSAKSITEMFGTIARCFC